MKKKYFILLISAVAFIISGLPLLLYGINKTFFYSIDPDVVYVTNALLYTKYAIIAYADHPGTPTIMLLYYLFIPLRLIAKYIFHQGFIQWSFNNYAFLTYYVRVFELVLTTLALFIYLNVIKKLSNSNWITLLTGFCLFSFAGLTFALRIIPENFSFFLTAIWFLIFVKFTKTRKYFWNTVLVVIAGFAFANKFTSLFLFIASFFLPLYVQKTKIGQKLVMMEANIAIFLQAFLLGIWPIRNKLAGLVEWGISLFTHAGNHGTGVQSTFDKFTYLNSAINLIWGNPFLFIFICFTLMLGIFLIIKRKIRVTDPIVFLMFTAILGIAVFVKYPNIYYSYVNILLIIFCNAYFLSKTKLLLTKFLLIMMSILFLVNAYGYIKSASNDLNKRQTETINSILRSWTPFWSADIFRDQFNALDSIKP